MGDNIRLRIGKEISELHGRSVNAIKFKALGYAADQVLKEGKTQNDVVMDLGLSETDLQKELDKRTKPKVAKPVTAPKTLLVIKKANQTATEDLAEIWSSINKLQSLVHRYMNKVTSK